MATIRRVALSEILSLRKLFLSENHFQIRYNAVHERGWSDSYLILEKNQPIGYASVKGNEKIEERNTLFEFYLLPDSRDRALEVCRELMTHVQIEWIESQSNEPVLTSVLHELTHHVESEIFLFKDGPTTQLSIAGATFRKRRQDELTFEHQSEPEGSHVVEQNGVVVGTGGFLLHYNFPFADLYMEVKGDARRRGVGSFLIQELKKVCREAGRVPAARCHVSNHASKATLIRGGMEVAGRMLKGKV